MVMGEVIPFPTKIKEEPEEPVATITVYDSGRVSGWLSNRTETHEQMEWTRARLTDGVFCVASMLDEGYNGN